MLAKLRENIFLFVMIVVVLGSLYTINASAEEKTWLSYGWFEVDLNNDGVIDCYFDSKDITTLYEICK